MTVPQERENDPPVLELLGFGTPARLDYPAAIIAPAQLEPVDAPTLSREPALTRRELRERERVVESSEARPTEAARGSAATGPARTKAAKPRRAAKKTNRRDDVRTAAAPKKSAGKRVLSFAAMLFAGALAVGMTVPANAFDFGTDDADLAESLTLPAQSLEVDPTLVSFSERDAWNVTSWAEMLRLRYGNRSFDYTIGTGPIRWPFPYAVPITSGFGARAAPCRGCSTDHSGLDFGSGYGAAIFSVGDGVVVERSTGGGTWGNFVVIEGTTPDGQVFQAGYAHMASDSSPLVLGDQVRVGDFIGLTGATGQVSGAHLHFTIKIDGSFVDPFTFLKRYAG